MQQHGYKVQESSMWSYHAADTADFTPMQLSTFMQLLYTLVAVESCPCMSDCHAAAANTPSGTFTPMNVRN